MDGSSPGGSRVLALWFPRLGVRLAERQRPGLAGRAIVLIQGHGDEALVTAASCDATAAGVLPGVAAGQARGRCPGAIFLADNGGACLDELECIAAILRRYATPRIVIADRDLLLLPVPTDLDTRAEQQLAARITGLAAAWSGHPVRGGLADTRAAAAQAARAARRDVLVCPREGPGEGDTLPAFREESLTARLPLPAGADALHARAALGHLAARLQALLDGAHVGFRSAEITLEGAGGSTTWRTAFAQPTYAAVDALQPVRAALDQDGAEALTAIQVTLGRLAPDVRVGPLAASRAIAVSRRLPAAQGLRRAS